MTWDSVHYLHLSLFPTYGDIHSLGLGYLLKFFASLASLLGHPLLFRDIVFCLHIFSLSIISALPIASISRMIKVKKDRKVFAVLAFLNLIFWFFVFPSLLLLINALWTEMLYMLLCITFALIAYLFFENKYEVRLTSKKVILGVLFSILVPVAYHIRYQMIIIPVAMIATGLVFSIRNKKIPYHSFSLAIIGITLIFFTNLLLKQNLPSNDGAKSLSKTLAMISAQCSLKCDVALFKVSCQNSEGKKIIKNSSCSDLTLGHISLGEPRADIQGITDLIKYLGFTKVVKWFVKAPFFYLRHIHKRWGLEIGSFEFLSDNATNLFPAAAAYYASFLQVDGIVIKPLLKKLIDYLTVLHFKVKIYNWLCGFFTALNIVIIFRSKRFSSVFLAYISLGTLLVFSYFNPHVPFRFLIQIIVPSFVAVLNELNCLEVLVQILHGKKVKFNEDK